MQEVDAQKEIAFDEKRVFNKEGWLMNCKNQKLCACVCLIRPMCVCLCAWLWLYVYACVCVRMWSSWHVSCLYVYVLFLSWMEAVKLVSGHLPGISMDMCACMCTKIYLKTWMCPSLCRSVEQHFLSGYVCVCVCWSECKYVYGNVHIRANPYYHLHNLMIFPEIY